MSSIQDPQDPNPKGGDGPNAGARPDDDLAAGASAEQRQDEDRGEDGGRGEGGRLQGDDAPKTASKGINPVQHSE